MWELRPVAFLAFSAIMLAPDLRVEAKDLASEDDRAFYALGLALAESVSRFDLSAAELELVVQGLADGVGNRSQVRFDNYSRKVEALAKKRLNRTFEEQERAGAKFRAKTLAAYRNSVMTESGMIAIPVREGTGAKPDLADTVRISYEGSLVDGTVFDRTQAGTPLTVPIEAAAMPCLKEGLQRMRVGAAQRLICPPVRGFSHPRIKAGSTLIYDIELLGIVEEAQ